MGIPKHTKESSRTKSSKKYKDAGRKAINVARHLEKQKKIQEKAKLKKEARKD